MHIHCTLINYAPSLLYQVTPPSTTEKASIVSVVDSLFEADVTSVIRRSSGSSNVMESIAVEEEINTQWIYYQTDDYAVYIIQKFNEVFTFRVINYQRYVLLKVKGYSIFLKLIFFIYLYLYTTANYTKPF